MMLSSCRSIPVQVTMRFLNVVHGWTAAAVLAVPPVAIEEDEMRLGASALGLVDAEEMLHARARPAALLGIELADLHDPRWEFRRASRCRPRAAGCLST
jgi:hypothetical protein